MAAQTNDHAIHFEGRLDLRIRKYFSFLPIVLLAAPLPLPAQQMIAVNNPSTALPDAPQPVSDRTVVQESTSRSQQTPERNPPVQAPRLAKYIQPEQRAVPLSALDKLELAGWEQIQPYSVATQILAAGWEHLLDSNPNYGTDKAGFGEKIGAAAIRQSSQAIFSDGILAAAFHQDPRYYRKGSGKIVDRVMYSATRVIITRTDAGKKAPNYSEIFGYAGAAALTMTYYPAVSATWHDTAEGYAISMSTAALGNQLHEFAPDLLKRLYRWHRHDLSQFQAK